MVNNMEKDPKPKKKNSCELVQSEGEKVEGESKLQLLILFLTSTIVSAVVLQKTSTGTV